MNALYWHATRVKMKAIGPMGAWLVCESSGATELVPSTGAPLSMCLGQEPRVANELPCGRCGWDWQPRLVDMDVTTWKTEK